MKSGKSVNTVASEVGISSGVVTRWKKGGDPSERLLLKVAQYFNVPPDDLVSLNLNITASFSEDEIELLKAYRKLNHAGKQQAMTQIQDLTHIEHYREDTALSDVS